MVINQQIIANVPAEEKTLSAKWIVRSVNKIEVINWLKGIRKVAPNALFQSMLSLTETKLSEERRDFIQNALF